MTMAAMYDVPTMTRPVRIGTVVDDMIITVPRDMPEVGDIEMSKAYASMPLYAPEGVRFIDSGAALSDIEHGAVEHGDAQQEMDGGHCVNTIQLSSIPTITLDGPQGTYTMHNPSTWAQAKVTPQAARWEKTIRALSLRDQRQWA